MGELLHSRPGSVWQPYGRSRVLYLLKVFSGKSFPVNSSCRSGKAAGNKESFAAGFLAVLLALFSGICWAFYTVLSRRATSRYGGLVNGTAAIILGDAMLLLLTLFFKHPVQMDFSLSFWLYALYMGIFPSALAYVLWASALKHLEAGKLGSLGYASTLLTMTFSFLLLKERIDPIFIGGVLLVLGGIYFMLMERSPFITKNCRQERSIL